MIADPVIWIQNGLTNLKTLHLQAANDFPNDAFDGEVRAVDDMRVLGDDERRGATRRISPVPRGDLVAQALGLAATQPDVGGRVDVKLVGRIGKNHRSDVAP